MKANGDTAATICETLGKPVARLPDPASALCAKLTTNMSHQQWRDWVSPDIDYIEACPGLLIPPDAPAH